MDKHELSKGLFDAFNKDNDEKMKKNPRLETNRNGWYNRNKRMTTIY